VTAVPEGAGATAQTPGRSQLQRQQGGTDDPLTCWSNQDTRIWRDAYASEDRLDHTRSDGSEDPSAKDDNRLRPDGILTDRDYEEGAARCVFKTHPRWPKQGPAGVELPT
jgi:hypothetical protein